MAFTKETKWLCENASALEKFSGKWVAFSADKGVLANGKTLAVALRKMKIHQAIRRPFVFHVPSKDELLSSQPHANS